jgi:fumarate hydratase class II
MKKSDLKLIIRKIVREEVAMAIQEVITELKQPTQQQISQPKPKKKMVEKKSFTTNSVLNDVLNETAMDDEWKTMGGGTYDSSKMNEVLSSQYNDTMNGSQAPVNPNDPMSQFLNKDYRQVLKKVDEKAKQTRGV